MKPAAGKASRHDVADKRQLERRPRSVTIASTLRQVRENRARLQNRASVEQACRELNHAWRDRRLDLYTPLHLFILHVLNRNTAMTHLPHLSGKRFTASAYCQARQRVGPRRISFIDALRWLKPPKPEASLRAWVINPERPGRIEPRGIKRRQTQICSRETTTPRTT